jgi:hypothetical protein
MKKIKTLFKLDPESHLAIPEVLPGSEWVIAGEGVATEKFNGTCCLIKDGVLYKRYDRKLPDKLKKACINGSYIPKREDFNPVSPDFIECDDSALEKGHILGWLPVSEDKPEDQWHREAFATILDKEDGTYELVGPKVQANPYNLSIHKLWKHGSNMLSDVPRNYDEIKEYFKVTVLELNFKSFGRYFEGIVWHHPDGRMVKIRCSDFGLARRTNE